MSEVILRIDRWAPGTNKLKRMNKHVYRKKRDMWIQDMQMIYRKAGKPDIPIPCEITYIRCYWNRMMDWDNCAGSFKLVGDALSPPSGGGYTHPQAGWLLPDDDPSIITNLDVRQHRLHRDECPMTKLIFREPMD